jgi:DNA-3-methyladenine glycosylase I
MSVVRGDDGIARCWWADGDPLYERYHDEEWGRPVTNDDRLFEKLVLEGFQAGLSWITILRKRERFREVFRGFEIAKVAAFGPSDTERLLGDTGIIRHRGKIEAAVRNAGAALEMISDRGSLASWFWPHAGRGDRPADGTAIPAITEVSTALSRDLKRAGWSFVGPTTVYAFMQAMGLVNDHLAGCPAGDEAERLRGPVLDRFGV